MRLQFTQERLVLISAVGFGPKLTTAVWSRETFFHSLPSFRQHLATRRDLTTTLDSTTRAEPGTGNSTVDTVALRLVSLCAHRIDDKDFSASINAANMDGNGTSVAAPQSIAEAEAVSTR